MGRIRMVTLMAMLITLFLIFYASLHLETSSSYRTEQRYITRNFLDNNYEMEATLETESTTQAQPKVYNVSEDFKKLIPDNKAYWNRMLHFGLRSQDNGKSLFKDNMDCNKANREHMQLNLHDINNYPALFQDFLLLMNCRIFPVIINPPAKCISRKGDRKDKTTLLLAIKSTPWNFVQRQVVRETWGQEIEYEGGVIVKTLFLLGTTSQDSPDLSSLLSFEAKRFGDILQWEFQESFFNLTLKMNLFLRWTQTNCPHVSFVFSGDDDVFVNTPALASYLRSLKPSKADQLYVGHILSSASPIRDPKNKYYIPMSYYDGPYPLYAGGGGFIISGALLHPLYLISHVIPFFPIDDVYTGMCTKALGIIPEEHKDFHTFDIREQDRENLCVHKKLILIHQRLPKEMKRLWRGIHSPLLTC
ncbi:UDP-c:betaGal beta-1,3-N-acetylglucosaminyltransferase 8 [Solea senegalensis]|uniref:Hexosyltransferase n=1 Tax=Solea senegalensis TaxID=28829 RepID=A0AAV6PZ38_SOLSE|nr:N-acetyllactosaminide beta-1,3-N-acetylglucosaminyltransferase 2 [Solea senegalensis]XP_043888521.1 N-acetyllactosaminide beta-1,3-N-acetylglucosaminyltransferase 2 [Solea senegalensis]XP_043888522.1 N-acetyllactosaminide beta-1,3-N-acetylglucosaminyltransferase 2 [Solea senegalensis]KAG7479538.1 UDP-c:betaGal beta-1,3-N-acetylglucosaminyltransferase 8 [Solea senegalensis]